MNIDGTPLCRNVDLHGNFYGAMSFDATRSDTSPHTCEPSVNIDGTPMCGGVDLQGNPYGIASHETDWSPSRT